MAHSLRLFPLGESNTRRVAGEDDGKPLWQLPLYQQPDRPSKRLIDAHQASIAKERRLTVPSGINLLQQAEEVDRLEALDDFRHCDCCNSPVDADLYQCPKCGWGG